MALIDGRQDRQRNGVHQGKTKMAWVILVIAVGLAAAWLLRMDDLRRDLTTNVAATDVHAAEPNLRPLTASVSPEAMAALVASWAAAQPHWHLQQGPSGDDPVRLHLVRTTRWLRFQDDVRVAIVVDPDSGKAVLTAESRSRVGTGDLGQNPRNLKELIGGLRQALDSA